MRKGLFSLVALVSWTTLVAPPSLEAQVALRVESAAGAQINVDGQLSEWKRIRFGSYGASAKVALAHDARGLYVAAQIDDERVVAGGRCGNATDAVVLSLQRPAARSVPVQVWLCPGERRRAAGASLRSAKSFRALRAATVVEMKRKGGYSLEAFVPWKAIPDGRFWEQFEGTLGIHDVDSATKPEPKTVGRIPSLNAGRFSGPELLDIYFLGGTDGLLFTFLQHQGSGAGAKRFDRWANVHGDSRLERLVLVGNQALVLGPGYRDGESYDVIRLPIQGGADVVHAEFAELTSDGRDELVLWLRQSDGSNSRVIARAFRFSSQPFEKIFDLEVRRHSGGARLACDLVLPRKRGAPLVQTKCDIDGFNASKYRPWGGSNAIEIIKPWTGTTARTFRWKNGAFAMAEKRDEIPREPASSDARQTQGGPDRARPVQNSITRVSVSALIKAFKASANLSPAAKPNDAYNADVAADGRKEKVLRFGKHIAVLGEGYLGGKRWFHYAVPVAADSDVRRLRVHDVTGNGKAELLFEFVQRIGDIERVLLAVHCLGYKGFPRILTVEIERRQGKRVVRNAVSLAGTGSGSLRIKPTKAKGWGKSNWHFADNNDEVGPLLLPWRDAAVRYRFVRNQGLVPSK